MTDTTHMTQAELFLFHLEFDFWAGYWQHMADNTSTLITLLGG